MNPWSIVGGLLAVLVVAAASYLEGHRVGENDRAVKDNAQIATLNSTISTMKGDADTAAMVHDRDVAKAEQQGAANVAQAVANTNTAIEAQHAADQKTIDCMRHGGCGLRIPKSSCQPPAGGSPVPGAGPAAPGSDDAGTVALDSGTSADLDTYAVQDVNKIIGNLTKLQAYATEAQKTCNGH